MVHHDLCPLCSSEKIPLFQRCKDHLVTGNNFDLLKCSECGFIFTQDYPDEDESGIYYDSEGYISHSDTAPGFLNRIYLVTRNFMLRRKRDLINRITGRESGNLLDIGCGTGYFAGTMKQSGWDVKAVEPGKKAREFASSRFGLDVREPSEIKSFEAGTFDCITMWHVLEHLHEPFRYMREISRLIKSGGRCIIALPNSASSDAAHYGNLWAAYDVPRHIWHFNPQSFLLFAEKTGFRINSIRSLPLDVFYISMLSEKQRRVGLPFITGILKGIRFSISSLGDHGKSSSVIYILEKKEESSAK